MAGQGVVLGYLKYVLGFDSLAFEKGTGDAEKRMKAFQRSMTKMADGFKSVGESASKWVTLPIVAAGAGILKMAGDFESAMNEVSISTQATSGELAQMKDLALDIGKNTTKSASESAKAMDTLAKAGLSTRQILDGAARATVALAEATGSELEPAAAAITDTMSNFKIETADLPKIINQITGAVNQSKFDFADFQYAMGSAGGVAGKVGVSFEDFAAVLAGTSSAFSSGQDAGTSFKTMLLAIGNPTKKARAVIQQYGLAFYDAAGKLKPMRDIAEQLRVKFAALSDEARTSAMADLFGSDAMRSGLALMAQGAEGIDKITAAIAKTDAAAQAAQRMKGLNAELEKLGGAFETLAIKIADAGLISAITAIVSKIGEFVDWMSTANPELLKWGTILAVVAAAVGPVLMGIGGMVSAVGALVPLLGGAGLGGALGAIAPLLGPIGIAVAAVAAAWVLFGDKIGPVLSELGAKIQETLGPKVIALFNTIGATLTELWNGPLGEAVRGVISILGDLLAAILRVLGPALISILSAAVDVLDGAFKLIGGLISAVAKLLSGDFSGAWEAAKGAVIGATAAIASAIDTLTGGALTWLGNMVIGIRDWLVNKLGAIFDWVGNKIEAVKGWFFGLYDAVVGHSYIPDMVDGIKAQMERLDAVLVQPVQKATSKASAAIRDMAQSSLALLDELFPEVAKLRDLEGKLSKLDAMKKGGVLTEDQFNEARFRLMDQSIKSNKPDDNWKLPEPADIEVDTSRMQKAMDEVWKQTDAMSAGIGQATKKSGQAFVDMARTATSALSDIIDAVKNGNWLDILDSVLNAIGQVISAFSGQGAGGFGGGGGGGGFGDIGAAFGSIFGGGGFAGVRAGGGAVMPGKTYWVGEQGPEPFTPNRSGFITPSRAMDNRRRETSLHFDLRNAVMTQDLLNQMNAMANGAAASATANYDRRRSKAEGRKLGRGRQR